MKVTGLVLLIFLLFSFSRSEEINTNGQAKPKLDESAKLGNQVDAIPSKIKVQKPDFPSFYIWRRVYQKKKKSYFKLYVVQNDGSLKHSDDIPVSYGEWRTIERNTQSKTSIKVHRNLKKATRLLPNSGETPVAMPTMTDIKASEMISPTGIWASVIDVGSNKMYLKFKKTSASRIQITNIPGFDGQESELYGWYPIGWSSNKDLFYFLVTGGVDTGRNNNYFQFDPESKTFTHIGSGAKLNLSMDGKWVVWTDGDFMDYSDREIHIYDVDKNRDYTLTTGHSDNVFFDWAKNVHPEIWSQINEFIENGKKFYRLKQYKEAIAEYLKAIELDPNNDAAYGYMGYSYFLLNDLDKAETSLLKAIGLNSDNEMSYYNLALISLTRNNVHRTVFWLQELYRVNDGYKKLIRMDVKFREIVNSPEYKKMARN